jgi:soluble lytic murein transglycosylase-like protein
MAKRAGAETWLWFALGGAALAYLVWWRKEDLVSFGTSALEAGKELYFKSAISNDAQDYSDLILQVAKDTGIDPFLIAALGDRESRWGNALSPRGPWGTGDAGHGRGLLQIDDRSFGPDENGVGSGDGWLASHDWRDPETNIRKGAELLASNLRFFQGNSSVKGYTDGTMVSITTSAKRFGVAPGYYPDPRPLGGDLLTAAALAAYNTGAANVLMALACGKSPDTTTANGNYSGDVLARAASAAAEFSSIAG